MVRVQVLGGVLASEPSLAKWAHRPTGRCRCRKPERPTRASMPDRCPGAIPGGSTEKHSPVVQRQRRLVHIQAGVVRFRAPTRRVGRGLLTMPRYANRQSGSAQTRGFAGSIPALGTRRNVLVEQRSARLPVTQETVGSNPIGDAQHGTVRQSGRATKLKPWWMGVRVPLVLLKQHASAGHW